MFFVPVFFGKECTDLCVESKGQDGKIRFEKYFSTIMKDFKLKFFNKLKPFASEHRNNSTKAEIRLWCELLRNGQMDDFRFLRQRPIDKYIVDFICRKAKLIIEVDGYSHQFKYEGDIERDRILKEWGYVTLRFTDDELKNHIQNVRRAIEQALGEQMKIIS